jgi:hypothetical protein
MPRVFRAMKRDPDDKPLVERSASGLGVRPGIDIDVNLDGDAIANGKGMSVCPAWRDIAITRIPKRLRNKCPGARGSNTNCCFALGTGAFLAGPVAQELSLVLTGATHGHIAPLYTIPLVQFEANLAVTRSDWEIDETG